jgi:penicillin-binding protein 1C
MSGSKKQKLRSWSWTLVRSGCLAVILFVLLDCIFPVKADLEYAPLIRSRDGNVLHAFLTKDQQWRFETKLSELTPGLKQAILFKEDKYYYRHFGINPLAVGRALFNNLFQLRRTSGASTISMQVARLLNPRKRSYVNKCIEMFRALQLECHYSKDQLLELYLNLAPYGSNIQGVKAASLLYFNKSPDQLSLAELTALSIIPNRPNSLVMGRDNAYIIQERNKWLQRFGKAGLFPKSTIDDALAEPLTAYRHDAPRGAPQISWRLRNIQPGALDIRSTLNAGMQRKAEEIVANYSNALRLRQINNAAVLVVDNRTHEVLVYIGSPDFKDRKHCGQVDGVKALRSPGSTLKPFLYGLAFDAGLATPQTVLSDVPLNVSGYTPENYDMQFRGRVSVEDALRQSLNIPAVKTLQQLRVPVFAQHLGGAGFLSVWQQRRRLGLSMILGGVTVRLEELTALYSAFANEGVCYPLQWTLADTSRAHDTIAGQRLLSPAADYMLCKTLSELTRPDLPHMYEAASSLPRVAWKTGTSYGRKDAWSIGFNAHYTIGVWLGNFDGRGVPELSGAVTATPLLFELFNALDRNAAEEWLKAPADLAARYVCRETGKLPSDFCGEQVMDTYIPGISSSERCDHQRDVSVSADGSFSYCTSCLPPAGYKTNAYPNVPADIASWYEEQHITYERIPPHNPSCGRLFDGRPPVINTLQNGMTYLIMDKGKQELQLGCSTANDVQQVYWYVDNKFYAAARAGEKLFFKPGQPKIKISCSDDKGRNAGIEIQVRFL